MTDLKSYFNAVQRLEGLIRGPAERHLTPQERKQAATQRLERTRYLLHRLGLAHINTDLIHIGGTSGKGSIATMCHAILLAQAQELGYSVGLYTSPYLQTATEKLRVDDALVSAEDFVALGESVLSQVDRVKLERLDLGDVQYTEAWLALVLSHFRQSEVRWAVIEVGMGGRHDSTNVIAPSVSVISSVHFDHLRALGPTLSDIAHHKAGIIKPGVPVVVGALRPDAAPVIERVASDQASRLLCAGTDFDVEVSHVERAYSIFDYRGLGFHLRDLRLNLGGLHQVSNAAIALAALETFAEVVGFTLTERAIR
ncbi:MAG: hypothetical protein GYB68_17600, partial [Chloroflexi bacterium]|nr:hypothetical protein [Chloroflexota bacterium]